MSNATLDTSEQSVITFNEYVAMARRWWWLLVLVPALALAVAYWYRTQRPPSYEATTTLYVTPASLSSNDMIAARMLATTYAKLVVTRPVFERVIADKSLPYTLGGMMSRVQARSQTDTSIMEIVATDSDPVAAARLANAVAETFSTWIQEPAPADPAPAPAPSSAARVTVPAPPQQPRIVQLVAATPPTAPASNTLPRDMALALGLSLALTALGIIFIERTTDRVWRPDDVVRRVSLPVLAAVPRISTGNGLEILNRPQSPASQAIRALRTRLQFAAGGRRLGVVAVISGSNGDSRSAVAANLAVALAQTGQRVLLVDADLAHPHQSVPNNVAGSDGLSQLLAHAARTPEELMVQGQVPGLYLIPAGPVPGNPAELLASERLRQVIVQMKSMAHVVIVDSPLLRDISEALPIIAASDHALLVADNNRSRVSDLQAMVAELGQTGVDILGVALYGARRTALSLKHLPAYSRPSLGVTLPHEVAPSMVEPKVSNGHKPVEYSDA